MTQQNSQILIGSNLMKDTFLCHSTSLEASHFYLRSIMEELWKPVKGYEGLYEVSNLGVVKSLAREWVWGRGSVGRKPETTLKPYGDGWGYSVVSLCLNGKTKTTKIHILVWDSFSDIPRNGRKVQVDHKDGNKSNNYFSNLQLLASRENVSKGKLINRTDGLSTGVSWHKRDKKYQASIQINNRRIYLGYFDTPEEASEVYRNKLNLITFKE